MILRPDLAWKQIHTRLQRSVIGTLCWCVSAHRCVYLNVCFDLFCVCVSVGGCVCVYACVVTVWGVCWYLCVPVRLCTSVCLHALVSAVPVWLCPCPWVRVYVAVCMYDVCIYVSSISACLCICVCTHVYMHICVYVCTYMHIVIQIIKRQIW